MTTISYDEFLTLDPQVEIPAREKWLFQNKTALKSVQHGLKQAAQGRVSKKGNFAEFAEDNVE